MRIRIGNAFEKAALAAFALTAFSLIAVAHDEADHGKLQRDVSQRSRELVREKMRTDPALARKVAQLLSE